VDGPKKNLTPNVNPMTDRHQFF